MKKFVSLLMVFIFLIISASLPSSASENGSVTLFFAGGYGSRSDLLSCLKNSLDVFRSSHPDSLFIHLGSFSDNGAYSVADEYDSFSLKYLGLAGFDCAALGYNELYRGIDRASRFIKTAGNDVRLPDIISTQIYPDDNYLKSDFDSTGIKYYSIFKRSGYTVAVFSLFNGYIRDLLSYDGVKSVSEKDAAVKAVDEIKKLYSPDLTVCVYEGGTDSASELVSSVEGVDLIVCSSGGNDSVITERNTVIASLGADKCAGYIEFDMDSGKKVSRSDFFDPTVSYSPDADTFSFIKSYDGLIDSYYKEYGFNSGAEFLCSSSFALSSARQPENPLGELIADSFNYALSKDAAAGEGSPSLSIVSSGFVKNGFNSGNITVSDSFSVLPTGSGPDGSAGAPLCSIYLYGYELFSLAEINASLAVIHPEAMLYFSGLKYSYHKARIIFNRVYDCRLTDPEGNEFPIDRDGLYRVNLSYYDLCHIGFLNSKSFNVLKITPKNADGKELKEFGSAVINTDGNEFKAWYALASYLLSFGSNGLTESYSRSKGLEYASTEIKIEQFTSNLSIVTFVTVLLVLLVLIAIFALLISFIKRRRRRLKRKIAVAEDDGNGFGDE